MSEIYVIPDGADDSMLMTDAPEVCEFPGELKCTPTTQTLADRQKAQEDEICYLRQYMVRYTDVLSPSELAANHPGFEVYVATTGDDTTGRGTLALPFATPNRAILCLDRMSIPAGIQPTIHVLNGTYNFDGVSLSAETVILRHSSSVNILLVGESIGGVTFNFSGVSGVIGGDIKNLIVTGDSTEGTTGILLQGTHTITDTTVNSFGIGIVADHASCDFFGACEVNNNLGAGVQAKHGGHVGGIIISDNNGAAGFSSVTGGIMYVRNSTSTNNLYGFLAQGMSYIDQLGSTVAGNTTDYSPAVGVAGNRHSYIF